MLRRRRRWCRGGGVGGGGHRGAVAAGKRGGRLAFSVGLRGGRALRLAAASPDGDVSEDASLGPIAAAGLTEVSGLGEVVIVVVTEFGVEGVAARALECLVRVRPHSPISEYPAGAWCHRSEILHLDGGEELDWELGV